MLSAASTAAVQKIVIVRFVYKVASDKGRVRERVRERVSERERQRESVGRTETVRTTSAMKTKVCVKHWGKEIDKDELFLALVVSLSLSLCALS